MKLRTNLTSLALVLAAFGAVPLLEGCRSTQPASTQMSDTGITTKVKSKLVADPDINPFNIDVTTNEGTVYLVGRVKDQKQKDEAERLARDTKGVVKVVNEIKVGDMKDTKPANYDKDKND